MKSPLEQNYYELLEVPRDATIAELDRAYDRAKAYYGPGSIATYALTTPEELKLVQDRIDEAYLVLAEEKARAEYLARIGPPTPDERPLHREVREAQAERQAVKEKEAASEPLEEAPTAPPPAEEQVAEISPPLNSQAAKSEPSLQRPEAAGTVIGANEAAAGAEGSPQGLPSTAGTPRAVEPEAASSTPAESQSVPASPSRDAAAASADQSQDEKSESEEKASRAAQGPVPPPLMEFPEPSPRAAAPKPKSDPRTSVRALEVPSDATFTGELLRQVRESLTLTLQDLSDRTKIGRGHLENIEADRYDALPAQVYLRGFLMSYAREVRLDPLRVAKSYLDAATKARAGKAR